MPPRRPAPPGTLPALPDHVAAAAAVRRRRLELGWTQEQLAERSGVSAATVRKVETAAQTHYRDLTCSRLCAALDWAPDALDTLRSIQRRPDHETQQLLTTSSSAPGTTDVARAGSGAPSDAEVAALSERIARLDARQWERLLAFVDGLTAIDH